MKERLDALAADDLVTAKRDGSLTLYTYTQKCVFSGAWNYYTSSARGLVLDDGGKVVARPWRKFFNLNERPETHSSSLPAEVPEMSEKMDGSLVIVFFDGGSWRAVTKGAWDSPQARWAQEWIRSHPAIVGRMEFAWTYLFELVAPWNRIVLPYKREDMVLIGAVHTEGDYDLSYEDTARLAATLGVTPVRSWRGPLDSVNLADESVKDAEGFVVRYSSGLRVKMKYATYILLHKVVTGLSVKGIWERLCAGEDNLPDGMPDELMAWFTEKKAAILADRARVAKAIDAAWLATDRTLPRKDIALSWAPLDGAVKGSLFKRLDGKPYDDLLWKACKPGTAEAFFGGDL